MTMMIATPPTPTPRARARRRGRAAWLAGAITAGLAGCGSSGPASGPTGGAGTTAVAPSSAAGAMPRRSADDVAIASVNGRSVWASCVAAQAARIPGGEADRRRAALEQCIAFELLAQAAEARGLATAPEVAEAARAAEVNRVVETEFEQRYRTPADLGPQLEAAIKANEWRLHVPELRASTFARFIAGKDAPAELDAKARALADRLAAQLAGETGLFGIQLGEAARKIADGSGVKVETADFRLASRPEMVPQYAGALFAIPEVGRIAPPVRTPWGWDVVLWTDGVAAHERSRDDLAAEMFPELRRHQFQRWVTQIARQLRIEVQIDPSAVHQLDGEAGP